MARELVGQPPVLIGLAEPNPSDEGRPLFNAAVLLRGGRPDQRFRKALLPTYDVFDEDRYFEPYHGPQLLELGGRRIGVSICEDVWNDRDFWVRRRYHHDPVEELICAGAQAVVNLSASPFSVGKPTRREAMLSSMARKHRVPVVYVNQFGGNDDLVFDGRSCAFDATGAPIARGRAFEADVLVCDIDHGSPIGALPDAAAESASTWNGTPACSSSHAVSRAPCSSGRVSPTQTCSMCTSRFVFKRYFSQVATYRKASVLESSVNRPGTTSIWKSTFRFFGSRSLSRRAEAFGSTQYSNSTPVRVLV